MFRNFFYGSAICLGLVFTISLNCFAQDKTKDELKTEREVLKSERKSEGAKKREAEIAKLEPPKTSGVASVDGLATNSTSILVSTKSINTQLPEMYKRTIGETFEGVTDVTVKKPTVDELANLALTIATQIKAVAEASALVATASTDIKGASLMQAPKATKALNYSKDALALTGPELQMNLKVINNLIATLKSSNNN